MPRPGCEVTAYLVDCHQVAAEVLDAWDRASGLARQLAEVNRAIFRIACEQYLEHHRRLPGSERTKRLRKKRLDRVMRWWEAQPVEEENDVDA